MNSKVKNLFTYIGLFICLIILFIVIWPTMTFPFTKQNVKIKVTDKSSWIRITKPSHYYIHGYVNDEKEVEKFEIASEVFKSNKDLSDKFIKDSTYTIETYYFNTSISNRRISKILSDK
jgi:hypothetical protein